MKLMKHITIALVLCAIPAMAFGQAVSCDDCTHAVSVYMGEGGLIATADDADMVTYVSTCGGVTRSGELAANDDGVVSTLFTMDNGLACHTAHEGNKFELGPIMDGGWYWITDDMNSAVGNLVSMDVLENDTVDLTSAGDGVKMTPGSGAVYVKETSTGRVGILPNILPEPPVDATKKCGFADRGRGADTTTLKRFVRVTNECEMGDGGTILLATTTNSFTGATTRVMDKGSVVRPSGSGEVVVTADLWGNGSGHFTTDPTADLTSSADVSALLGHPSVSGTSRASRLTGVTYTAKLGDGPTAADLVSGTADGGVTMNTDTTNVVTFTITADSDHCNASPPRNHSVMVAVTAVLPAASASSPAGTAAQLTPYIARHSTSGVVGGTTFTIVCGSGSSSPNQGQELVPENPFPVD
jgi:hypothetical protein